MDQITVRLPTDVIEELDREADERDEFDSRTDVIRTRCASGGEGDTETDELRSEVDRLRTEVECLRRERRQLLDVREENTELVRFAEEHRLLVASERERRKKGVFTRFRYWITGEPD